MTLLTTDNIKKLGFSALIDLVDNGTLFVVDTEEQPIFNLRPDLVGEPIHISEAARKYNLKLSTLSIWLKHGYVELLFRAGNRKFLDEGSVELAARIYHSDPGQGKSTVKQHLGNNPLLHTTL